MTSISLRRGSVITVATGSGFGSKPRPALVMQADAFLESGTAIVLMFTSEQAASTHLRPLFHPDASNGLQCPSALMADIPVTVRRDKIGSVIGRLSASDLLRADRAFMLVLGFS